MSVVVGIWEEQPTVKDALRLDAGWRVMREDHGNFLGRLRMEGDPEDIGDKGGRCCMETGPQIDAFGEGIEQQARTKTLQHRHNHHLVVGILHFQDSLMEMPNVILQSLPIFLVDCEEVGGILFLDPVAHEIGDKELLRSPNESMILGDNFPNQDLAGPVKVAEKVLHITSSEYP
ncbi:hypothetical protein Acr_09g0001490 [Actinidia rufa]|uniref:Uncharacterized protein n=1 Tax=Actinidia rufa TaxID=165716 RepID=A0A7J0F532_9ERIC|nr:hypothetical protein Acr_09g0001490 [Actinidia rufa]